MKPPDFSAPQKGYTERAWLKLGICLCLALVTVAVYAPVCGYGFVNYDDNDYITNNSHVINGVSVANVRWAFSSSHAGNWHPVTWISHMLDCQWWGLNAGAHHLTNVLFHGLNSLLLFLVLNAMTGSLWRSAFVAALFAWHPLHVESVAWVSERKDVLSAFFGLLTLWAYVNYVSGIRCRVSGKGKTSNIEHRTSNTECEASANIQHPMPGDANPNHASRITQHGEESTVRSPRSKVWYGCALGLFALGLMSKPMLVTLPFVLLLLDYWPLQRFELSTLNSQRSTLWRLIREKVPMFLLVATASVATYLVQSGSGAVYRDLSLASRLANALVSYAAYIMKMFWPGNLAAFYPYRHDVPVWQAAGAAGLLLVVTALVLRGGARRRWLPVGWFWYLGTLVPVIGLVQTGSQSMADRYTYIPSIGLFIAVTWGAAEILGRSRWGRIVATGAGAAVLIACVAGTVSQFRYWRNDVTLFERALAVTARNHVAHNGLGLVMFNQGKSQAAIDHYTEAIRFDPSFVPARNNLGNALVSQQKYDEAIARYLEAIRLQPRSSVAYNNLGNVFTLQGRRDEAIGQYREALRLAPELTLTRCNLGNLLQAQNRITEAIAEFQEALRLQPNLPNTRVSLAEALLEQGQSDEAIAQCAEALRLKPGLAAAHYQMGKALSKQGRFAQAISSYEAALQLQPAYPEAHNNLGNLLAMAGRSQEALAHYQDALRLQPDNVEAHNNYGGLLLQQGRVAEAIAQYKEVLRVNTNFVPALRNLAWLRAACADAAFRDGTKALELAGQAVALTGGRDAVALDALAAAQAEAGHFEEAVETARKAGELAAAANQIPLVNQIEMRLKLYSAGSPYRLPK